MLLKGVVREVVEDALWTVNKIYIELWDLKLASFL